MKPALVIFISIFFLDSSIIAQDVTAELKRVGAVKKASLDSNGWKHEGLIALNFTQAALSDWSAGGETFLIGVNSIVNQSLHHRNGKYTLDAYLDVEIGVVEAASFKTFRKTNDRLDMTVEFEHELTKKHLNYGTLMNFNTQLFPGHNYALPNHPTISNFMTPGKLILCLGLDYKIVKSNSYFSVFGSPLTFRWVTKLDERFYGSSKFGVDSATKIFNEFGAYLSFHYNKQFSKTVQYIGRLDFFSNYRKHPENVDVLMNNLLSFQISKWFAASFLLDIIYDDDIKKRTQVQEIIGLGVKVNF